MLAELLNALPAVFLRDDAVRTPRVYEVTAASSAEGRESMQVETESGAFSLRRIMAIDSQTPMEFQLLDLEPSPDVLALVVVAEAWSTEFSENESQTFDILYFQGVTRSGESTALITYRNQDKPAKFDNLQGVQRVCLEVALAAPNQGMMRVSQWLAANVASRVSDYLSEWNQGAPPGEAPPFIATQCSGSQAVFFADKLVELTGGALTSVCWEASNEGELLSSDLEALVRGMVTGEREVDVEGSVSAARELSSLSWPVLVSQSRSGRLLPVEPVVARSVSESLLSRFAASVTEAASEIYQEWVPYAGAAGVESAMQILRDAEWISSDLHEEADA